MAEAGFWGPLLNEGRYNNRGPPHHRRTECMQGGGGPIAEKRIIFSVRKNKCTIMVVSYDLCIFYLFQNGGEFSKWTMGAEASFWAYLTGFSFCVIN